jgi:hypothetical protein
MTIRVQRMQVGFDWNSTFLFKSGDPPVPVSIADWIIIGEARLAVYPTKFITLYSPTTPYPEPLVSPIEVPVFKLNFEDYIIQEKDLEYDKTLIVGSTVNVLVVSLDQNDTLTLGPGMVDFEISRTDPQPDRPILQFRIMNHS